MAINVEKLAQKKARQGRGWQPKEGNNIIRILPPSSDYFGDVPLNDFAVEYHVHFLKVEGEEMKVTRCYKNAKKECPACALRRQYRNTEDPGMKKLVDQIKQNERHLLNILDLQNLPAGVQVYECGYMVYQQILDYAANPMWGDVFNPQAGRNFMLELIPAQRSRNGWNQYKAQPDPNVTNIMQYLPEGWMQQLDTLKDNVAEYIDEKEFADTLAKMGFRTGPQPAFTPALPQQQPTFAAPGTAAPVFGQPATTGTPAPTTGFPSFGQPVTTGTPAAPAESPPAAPQVVQAPTFTRAPDSQQASAALYPAGLQIDPATDRPVCYGDFDPAKHPCDQGCSARENCQLKMLGMGG